MFLHKLSSTFSSPRPFKTALLAGIGALALAIASPMQAAVIYATSFESPTFTSGTSVIGLDGWIAGSTSGTSQTVTNTRANTGTQSLFFDNSGANNSFYSVRHSLGSFAGSLLTLSVNVYIPSTNDPARLAEMEFSTGTLGGGTLGFSIDGAGDLRAGTTWTALYSNAPLGTAPAGTFADRWLTITLALNSTNGNGSVTASGFGGATSSYTYNFTGSNTAPTYVNLGTDYSGTTLANGVAYYDNVNISSSAVPEPSTVAISFLGAGLAVVASRRRRNRC